MFSQSQNGTTEGKLVYRKIRSIPWYNGKRPLDRPPCGFKNEKCPGKTKSPKSNRKFFEAPCSKRLLFAFESLVSHTCYLWIAIVNEAEFTRIPLYWFLYRVSQKNCSTFD